MHIDLILRVSILHVLIMHVDGGLGGDVLVECLHAAVLSVEVEVEEELHNQQHAQRAAEEELRNHQHAQRAEALTARVVVDETYDDLNFSSSSS